MTDLWLSGVFFSSSKYSKSRFRPEIESGPHWRSLRLGMGTLSPYPSPRCLRRLDLGAFDASVVSPQHKFLATSMLVRSTIVDCTDGHVAYRQNHCLALTGLPYIRDYNVCRFYKFVCTQHIDRVGGGEGHRLQRQPLPLSAFDHTCRRRV